MKPKFTTDFLEAKFLQETDDLTLRAEEEGILRTFMDNHGCT